MTPLPMFLLSGLDPAPFAALFDLDDAALRARGMLRRRAEADFGFPCRVSLEDAGAGEELLLLPFRHHAADSPYAASGPIYVRRGVPQARLAPGVVPACVSRRLMSLRAYDAASLMVGAEVAEGAAVAERLAALFADPGVAYVHLHNARPGCFSCAATRAG
jgi:hypothetical protein